MDDKDKPSIKDPAKNCFVCGHLQTRCLWDNVIYTCSVTGEERIIYTPILTSCVEHSKVKE